MANVIKHKRGSGSDPVASDLVVGEVAIRTDVGKLFTKMDNGSVAEIAGGGSDIAINTLSSSSGTGGGSATFNGSAYRFTLSQPPSVSAQQLLVSINGVIQKPVAGTGQPSEGFSVDGTDIILGDAPATGSDFFILTFKSLGVSEPADNSVTSAKIVDGAIVNADINASAAIAGTKIDPSFTSNITVSGTDPRIIFTDTNNNPDFTLHANGGVMQVENSGTGTQVKLESNGSTTVFGNLTANADLTVDTNTLHVDSTNNRVGIGTTSPATPLEVRTSSNTEIAAIRTGSIAAKLGAFASGESRLTSAGTNGFWTVYTGSSSAERMRIDSSGNVSIGNSSPESDNSHHLLTLAGKASNGAGGISFVDTSSNVDAFIFADTGSLFLSADYDNATADSSIRFRVDGSSEKMRIDSSGRLLLGTTSTTGISGEADDLIIGSIGSSTNRGITLATTGTGSIRWADAGDNAMGRISYSNSNDIMSLHTSNATRLTINGTGTVSIGGETPTSGAGVLTIKPHTSTDAYLKFRPAQDFNNTFSGTAIDCRNSANGTSKDIIFRSSKLAFWQDSAEKIRFSTNGISFNGDTDAANALDDYEEGIFSFTRKGHAGGFDSNYAISNQTGKYTKIGRLVTLKGGFSLSGNSGNIAASNYFTVTVGSLPFAPDDTSSGYTGAQIFHQGTWWAYTSLGGGSNAKGSVIEVSGNYLSFYCTSVTGSPVRNSNEITFTITYTSS